MMQNINSDISKISKTEKKKELLLRLPDDLFGVLKDFKKVSGVSYTHQIYTAIVWYYTTKGLINLDWITERTSNNNGNKKKEEMIDESEANQLNSFCDGDSCEFNPSLMEGS